MYGSPLHPVGSLPWCCSASTAPRRLSAGHHQNSNSQLDLVPVSSPSVISKKRTTGGCRSISKSLSAVQSQPWHGIRTRCCWLLARPTHTLEFFRVLSRVLTRGRRVACGGRGYHSIRCAENISITPLVGCMDAPSHLAEMHLHLQHTIAASPSYTQTVLNSHRKRSSVSAHSYYPSRA